MFCLVLLRLLGLFTLDAAVVLACDHLIADRRCAQFGHLGTVARPLPDLGTATVVVLPPQEKNSKP